MNKQWKLAQIIELKEFIRETETKLMAATNLGTIDSLSQDIDDATQDIIDIEEKGQ